MIDFERFQLSNGLRVLVHEDNSTPTVAINILYDVGARDEHPNQTGFAHLFEHLMFGGSVNIPLYDEPLQMAGGENNAYTTNDVTNYFIQIPRENMETAFWLESDRMLSLAFNKASLEVQRKVVIEEFKEHYINKPYGDVWSLLRSLAYTTHPYKWMTIGKEVKHIEEVTLNDVKSFSKKYYTPDNAVLCIAGNISVNEAKRLTRKWFESIPSGEKHPRCIPREPQQQEARSQVHYSDVPLNALYKAWHMEGRLHKDYYCADIITEILGGGQSSRLYQTLVKEMQLFSHIGCYHTGSLDPGLLIIEGKILNGVEIEKANQALENELSKLVEEEVLDIELEKAKNKIESLIVFEDMQLLARANNLAFYELLGDAAMMNTELGEYLNISKKDIIKASGKIFHPKNSNTLFYLKNNNEHISN